MILKRIGNNKRTKLIPLNTDPCDEVAIHVLPYYKSAECADIDNNQESKDCALKEMLRDMYDALVYPMEAIENNIEGDVHVEFQIDKLGNPLAHEVVKSIGYGCDEAAVSAVKSLKFYPAKNGCGDIIVSTMVINVKFRIE